MADGVAPEIRPWREREAASESRGALLDPRREPVPGLQAFATAYVPGHLLISGSTDGVSDLLTAAGAELGWEIEQETIRTKDQAGGELTRARIVQAPKRKRDDEPVPPIDAWRLLQQARRKAIEQQRASGRRGSRSNARGAGRTGRRWPRRPRRAHRSSATSRLRHHRNSIGGARSRQAVRTMKT